jgi:hypothetical protein
MCIVWDRHFTLCPHIEPKAEFVRCFRFRHRLACEGDEVRVGKARGKCDECTREEDEVEERRKAATMRGLVGQI